MRRIAGISMVLNLALLVVWAWVAKSSRDVVSPTGAPKRVVTRTVVRTNQVDVVESGPTVTPRFDWSMVESQSFEEYMFNLRRLECPEWLVKEIILAELMAFYDDRERDYSPARQFGYWASYKERRAREREFERARWDLRQEEYDVMKQLTGVYRGEESDEVLWEDDVFFMLFGDMGYEQSLALMSEVMFQHQRKEALDEMRKGFLTPTDIWRLAEGYRSMKVAGATIVSPGVFEEFWLRLQLILGDMTDDLEFPAMKLTGYQLRDLIRIRSSFLDPIEREFTGEEKPAGRELNELNQLVAEKIANTLGAGQADAYSRSQNQAFRQIHEFTDEQDLPMETAIAVFDVRQTAIDQVRNLISDPGYDYTTKSEMRRLIQIEIEQTLENTLGSAVYQDYRQSAGVWIDRVGGGSPAGNGVSRDGGRR
jgi:hypothetical protein